MSALGQKQTFDWRPLMSSLPPKADIGERSWDVRFVPIADMALIRSPRPQAAGAYQARRCLAL
jgi:hypothetical protein